MAILKETAIPTGVQLMAYEDQGYRFAYPEGGLFAEFDHGGGLIIVELVLPVGERYLGFSIKREPDDTSAAKDIADAFFAGASPLFEETDNLAPFQVVLAGGEGWRARKRFVDGMNAPLVIDSAFLQRGGTFYTFNFSASPQDYEAAQWVFDTLLKTFSLT